MSGEELSYPCSEDELTACGDTEKDLCREADEWAPPAAELEALYKEIEGGAVPRLVWRCTGRRPPESERAEEPPAAALDPLDRPPDNSNFDFTDEMNSLRLRVRREGEDTLRGSAKKKTSSFDGILSNVMRHKRIQQMEREQDKNKS